MAPLTLEDRRFYSDLVRIALPIAMQNMVASSVNMLDTVMVGRLGAAELAAVGLGNQIWFLLMLFLFGTSSGSGVCTAQFWGKRDIPGVRKTTGLSMTLGMGMGLFFMVLALAFPRFLIGLYSKDAAVIELGAHYLRRVAPSFPFAAASFAFSMGLRGVERVRLPLVATVISLFANGLLNYILIFGKFGAPALGVAGAAYATVISRIIESAIIYISAYARKLPPAGSLRELTAWRGGFLPRFMVVVMPVIVNEITWSLGITTYNAVMARIGTDAIAAYSVTNTVGQLAMVLFMGTANASAVMIGNRIGAGDRDRAFAWARRFAIMAPVIGVVVGALLVPASLALPWLFAIGPEPLRQVRLMLFALGMVFPFKVFNLHVLIGICRSGGDTRFGAFFDIFGIWAIGVPLAFIGAFVLKLEPWMVFAMLSTEEIAKCGFGLWRLVTKRWLNDVTV